jgi:cyclic pyranopterin phosphate synthase
MLETGRSSPGTSDRLGRPLRDLRISVTDRCNFRCPYCMPGDVFGRDYRFLPRDEILSLEEIDRLAGVFVSLGVHKLRISGGEPTVRRGLTDLVALLASHRTPDGEGLDLAMTTIGSALRGLAGPLAAAGLGRVTVSLDSLDDETFRRMNGVDFPVAKVLDGIDAAVEAGLGPVKVNVVLKRGENDGGLLELAGWAREHGHILRFIEFMDVGTTNGWRLDDVVPAEEVVATISRAWPLEPAEPTYRGEVAERWRYVDGRGEVGVIASVTRPFCGDCTRARISAEGKLYTCLFSAVGHDLRDPLRAGATDDELAALIGRVWSARDDRYSELRSAASGDRLPKIEMFALGG